MGNNKCVAIKVRKGIWDAFSEIAAKRQMDTMELIDTVLIDYIVDNVVDCHKFPDLLDDDDFIKPMPECE